MGLVACRTYLVCGGAVAVVALVPGSQARTSAAIAALGVASATSCWRAVRRRQVLARSAWGLQGIASALIALGALAAMAPLPGREPLQTLTPVLGGIVLMVSVLAMIVGLVHRRDVAATLDAGIVAFAMFSVLWTIELAELASGPLRGLPLLAATARPIAIVALAAATVRLAVSIRLQNPAYVMVVAAAGSVAALDTLSVALSSPGARSLWAWAPALVLIGAGALHDAARHRPDPTTLPPGWLTTRRFALIFVATVSVPSMDLLTGGGVNRVVVATSSGVLFILLLTRVFWLMTAVNRSQERLQVVAFHDPLTGLANRSLFADRVRHALLQRDHAVISALLIDLDDFKAVNDSLGHQAGDALLVSVAERLAACIREGDSVARLGGDEFAVLLENEVDNDDLAGLSERILDSLSAPTRFGEHEFSVGASIGIAIATDEDDVDSLLRNADVAMYLAKSKGKNRYEFFEGSMYDDATERLALKAALHPALSRGELELHFQPILHLANQQLHSVECLLRWRHPERGLVPPDAFIPLAEETGLIVPIGEWVLREACTQVRRWQLNHPDHAELGVAVNVSVRQVRDGDLVRHVDAALAETGLDPRHLTLEITESQLMEDSARSAALITELKALGVRIAIDDFGTGYSSLSYLRSFPFDSVKIDRSFVAELSQPGVSEALVRSVIYLADALGASVTAEGIEGFDQAEILARLGCHHGQGFLISRPLPAEELEWLLAMPLSRSLFAVSTLVEPSGPGIASPGPRAAAMARPAAPAGELLEPSTRELLST